MSRVLLAGGEELDPTTPAGRALASHETVAVVTLAAAFTRPERLQARIAAWASAIEVRAVPVCPVRRADALDPAFASPIADAGAVCVLDGSRAHFVGAIKATPLLDAIVTASGRGADVLWSGATAAAVCDPMVDDRGGALTVGLGIYPGILVATAWERWPKPRRRRLRRLIPDSALFVVLESGAVVQALPGGEWAVVGGSVSAERAGMTLDLAPAPSGPNDS